MSKVQKAYRALQTAKRQYCRGKKTAVEVKTVARTYVARKTVAAPKGEKDKVRKQATVIANRVLRGGCKMTSVIGKAKKGKKAKRGKRKGIGKL